MNLSYTSGFLCIKLLQLAHKSLIALHWKYNYEKKPSSWQTENSHIQERRSSSRRYPRLQKHWKEPALFWHMWSHPPLAAKHSSISVIRPFTQHISDIYTRLALSWIFVRWNLCMFECHTVTAASISVQTISGCTVTLITSRIVCAVVFTTRAAVCTLVYIWQTEHTPLPYRITMLVQLNR